MSSCPQNRPPPKSKSRLEPEINEGGRFGITAWPRAYWTIQVGRATRNDDVASRLAVAIRMTSKANCRLGSRLPHGSSLSLQRPLLSLAAAFVLAFIGVVAWPIEPWRSGETYDIAITALGEKNPDAVASQVWIASSPGRIDLGAFAASSSAPLGWEQRSHALWSGLVSYRNQPATISFHGVLRPEDGFLFDRHRWSGKVRVEINGETRDYDLYSPEPTTALAVPLSDFPGKAASARPNSAY